MSKNLNQANLRLHALKYAHKTENFVDNVDDLINRANKIYLFMEFGTNPPKQYYFEETKQPETWTSSDTVTFADLSPPKSDSILDNVETLRKEAAVRWELAQIENFGPDWNQPAKSSLKDSPAPQGCPCDALQVEDLQDEIYGEDVKDCETFKKERERKEDEDTINQFIARIALDEPINSLSTLPEHLDSDGIQPKSAIPDSFSSKADMVKLVNNIKKIIRKSKTSRYGIAPLPAGSIAEQWFSPKSSEEKLHKINVEEYAANNKDPLANIYCKQIFRNAEDHEETQKLICESEKPKKSSKKKKGSK